MGSVFVEVLQQLMGQAFTIEFLHEIRVVKFLVHQILKLRRQEAFNSTVGAKGLHGFHRHVIAKFGRQQRMDI